MLKLKLLHPEILMALASNGHGARILIADGNFPISTCVPPHCKRVFLNLSPGLLTVTDVLKVIEAYIPVESAIIMVPPDDNEQSIHREFKDILGGHVVFQQEKRFDFYRETRSE